MARLWITTATGALATDESPVGGGVAVLEALLPHLVAAGHEVTVLRPGARDGEEERAGARVRTLAVPMLAGAPADAFLHWGERAYARFALAFEAALGRFFEGVSPADGLVLANDVSEGPPFAALARRGFRAIVLYHVVVSDFFARRYLGGLATARAAALWRGLARTGLARFTPRLLRLVWEKERDAAAHAWALVPSAPLADALARAYPETGIAARTDVVPWGVIGAPDPGARARRAAVLRARGLDPERRILLTLSRISPEKRLELALAACERLARDAPELARGTTLCVAGGAAYMGGRRYLGRLQARAARRGALDVRFLGYVGGAAKHELLAAADLFVSTSAYEAYGLSIAQALAAGTPVVATGHQGALAILEPGLGWVVRPEAGALAAALEEGLVEDPLPRRARAVAWGAEHRFARAAQTVLARIDACLSAASAAGRPGARPAARRASRPTS